MNKAGEKISKAVFNQEAQETLRRSVTDSSPITSAQITHGDLNAAWKVTNDALGNVVDSRQLHARQHSPRCWSAFVKPRLM